MRDDFLNERRSRSTVRAICVECGAKSDARWRGWGAYRVEDPEYDDQPELAFYCPACAAAELRQT